MTKESLPVEYFESVTARDISVFIEQTLKNDLFLGEALYRGQNVQGNLLPGICRNNPEANTYQKEQQALGQLKLLGAAISETNNLSDLDWLAWAQHFGMKTRLLDWTSNPLAALWFACSSSGDGDVWVYAWDHSKLHNEGFYSYTYEHPQTKETTKAVDDPFNLPKTMAFQPRMNNKRLIAQHAWFSVHRFSEKDGRFVALESNIDAKNAISEIRIPKTSKKDILRNLDMLGINHRTLFPDEIGLCEYLNFKLKLG